jgi:hypothetical protein
MASAQNSQFGALSDPRESGNLQCSVNRLRRVSPNIHDRRAHLSARPDTAVGNIGSWKRQLAHGGVAGLSSLRAWLIWVRV